jgi:hypothetical protein
MKRVFYLFDIIGPCKYNGMFIDISDGFDEFDNYLKNWDDNWVMETSVPFKDVKDNIIKFEEFKKKKNFLDFINEKNGFKNNNHKNHDIDIEYNKKNNSIKKTDENTIYDDNLFFEKQIEIFEQYYKDGIITLEEFNLKKKDFLNEKNSVNNFKKN